VQARNDRHLTRVVADREPNPAKRYCAGSMGTYYETLGVKRSATTKEIRKAYLRRARALHPDRQLGRPQKEARKAEEAMQAVNVAWNILSNPTKKAEYDQGLNGSKGSNSAGPTTQRSNASGSTPRAATGKPNQMPPRRAAAASPSGSANRASANRASANRRPIEERESDGSISVWAAIPVLVILGLLLGIVIVTAFADDGGPDAPPRVDGVLNVGDCFVLVATRPVERDCAAGISEGQVTSVAPDPGNCPQDPVPLPDPDSNFFLCWVRMAPGSTNTIPPGS